MFPKKKRLLKNCGMTVPCCLDEVITRLHLFRGFVGMEEQYDLSKMSEPEC